ncbi:MAG: hypothetical protein KF729_17900 [Sandaracinaceae bacterium]|nr:hypothetical protein [Sandaracinaceae bacterium]
MARQRGAGSPTDVHAPAPSLDLPGPGARDPSRRPSPPAGPAPRGTPGLTAAPATAPVAAVEGPASAREPDYSDALRAAFGTPTDCISEGSRETVRGQFTVRVSVRATPTGRVTSASVNAPGLRAEDVACMTRRAEALRLPSPIEGAPRTITASIEYRASGTPGSRTDGEWVADWGAGTPAPGALPPGAQAPGIVTPAIGPSTIPGQVAPAHTLPALGPSGMPPGYVPPGQTLPAQGEVPDYVRRSQR